MATWLGYPATTGLPAMDCRIGDVSADIPDTVRRWAEVLARVPGSRLSLLAPGAETPQARAWISAAVADAGTDPSRIDFHANLAFDDYLRAHAAWDVVLDTWPFNGHTTTCHALWMGTPVVTLAGTLHVGRMGASVLHALGLDELAPDTPEQFVNTAARLALDLDRLGTLRPTLRDRMRASPMMDAGRFTKDLEAVFEQAARV